MSRFYEITPLDTLFFRGATPMEAGQYNTVSLFPPPVSVLKGAFWTELCRQHGKDYAAGLTNGDIPLRITGFYIKKVAGGDAVCYYVPAPATWYYDSFEKAAVGADCEGKKLCVAGCKKEDFGALGMQSYTGDIVFVKPEKEAKPLGGAWVSASFLSEKQGAQFAKDSILFDKDIYTRESRTGVALDEKRRAKDGQLYTSTHIRLHDGVSFVLSIDGDCDLEEGTMSLGGEQRVVAYRHCEKILLNKNVATENGEQRYLSLVSVEATKANLGDLLSSAKVVMVSGWDLKRGFHKPSVSWIPAGAVFKKNIDNICVPLAQ